MYMFKKPSNNIYKTWINTSIQEGSIYCCPKSDILDPTPIAYGSSGIVEKGTVKRSGFTWSIFGKKQNILSGMTVAIKTLILTEHSNKEYLYKQFAREVPIRHSLLLRLLCMHIDHKLIRLCPLSLGKQP